MKRIKLSSILAIAFTLILTGCKTYELQKTGDTVLTPRSIDCDFTVYTQKPDKEFDELGYINLTFTSGIKQAKERSRSAVCQSGGNAIILTSNEAGYFTSGTVIFTKEQ